VLYAEKRGKRTNKLMLFKAVWDSMAEPEPQHFNVITSDGSGSGSDHHWSILFLALNLSQVGAAA
jgi:hypothetical protein